MSNSFQTGKDFQYLPRPRRRRGSDVPIPVVSSDAPNLDFSIGTNSQNISVVVGG